MFTVARRSVARQPQPTAAITPTPQPPTVPPLPPPRLRVDLDDGRKSVVVDLPAGTPAALADITADQLDRALYTVLAFTPTWWHAADGAEQPAVVTLYCPQAWLDHIAWVGVKRWKCPDLNRYIAGLRAAGR